MGRRSSDKPWVKEERSRPRSAAVGEKKKVFTFLFSVLFPKVPHMVTDVFIIILPLFSWLVCGSVSAADLV